MTSPTQAKGTAHDAGHRGHPPAQAVRPTRSPSTTCRSPSSEARSSASSARTARARPPPWSASRGCGRRTGHGSAVLGLDPRRDRAELRQRRRRPAAGERAARQAAGLARRSTSTAPSTATRPTRTSCIATLGLAEKRNTAFKKLSGRPEAAAVGGARAGRQPRGRDARRAHHRARPAGPPRHLEPDRGHPRQGVTIVLVTHFMEEAERLCDRLAVIDAGRVVAARHSRRPVSPG